jgi:hypothetical protein
VPVDHNGPLKEASEAAETSKYSVSCIGESNEEAYASDVSGIVGVRRVGRVPGKQNVNPALGGEIRLSPGVSICLFEC